MSTWDSHSRGTCNLTSADYRPALYCKTSCYRSSRVWRGRLISHDPAKPTPVKRSTRHFAPLITLWITPTMRSLVTIGYRDRLCKGVKSCQFTPKNSFRVFLLQTLHLPVKMVRRLWLIRQTTCSCAYLCIHLMKLWCKARWYSEPRIIMRL
jgi:hypothetical protein